MTDQDRHQRAARFLRDAHKAGKKYEALPADLSPRDIGDAYGMQEAYHVLLAEDRGALAGYKIALTTKVMQEMVGFGTPCSGAVFQNVVHRSPAAVSASDYGRLGAECEVAARLGSGLPASGAPYDRDSVAGAVAALMPAFELVDDRGADYSDLFFLGVVADNAWNAGVVLGEEFTSWQRLSLGPAKGVMHVNGEPVGEGYGRDVLGHPLDALAWLANTLAERGKELSEGMVVMTGSIVSTKFLNPGDESTFAFEGLGQIGLRVG